MTKCDHFQEYLEESKNIFDIMAAACKMVDPYEPRDKMASDIHLKKAVYHFSESDDDRNALSDLKQDLLIWSNGQKNEDPDLLKAKFYHLIDLIDQKCAKCKDSSLPDPYPEYTSLNNVLKDEIVILPKFESTAIRLLSNAIAKNDKRKSGFRRRNPSRTAYISGDLDYFIILTDHARIKPVFHTVNYSNEIEQYFFQKGGKLKVGIFPLSNLNLEQMFHIKTTPCKDNKGLFSIEGPIADYEDLMIQRCIQALSKCIKEHVDIVVFPEMLFTKKIQDALCHYAQSHYDPTMDDKTDGHMPWFTWLGTVWDNGHNTCSVMDCYGKIIFSQEKYVSYIYAKNNIRFDEDISRSTNWTVHFLDIPNLFRIATAICRDISDDPLKDMLKRLYTDMLVIPTFSGSDGLTKENIAPLAMECIITAACNACSSLCKENEEKFSVYDGVKLPFCYLCLPGKEREKEVDNVNIPVFHQIKYNMTSCKNCDLCCSGHFFSISFQECTSLENFFSAKVSYTN